MNNIQIGLLLLISILLIGCTTPDNNRETDEQPHPNIVFIISDDQSWPDYSFMGHPNIQTPNIDKLASDGLTFTRGYLPAPVCRPTLGSMLTGLHPHQNGVTGNDPAFEFDDRQPRVMNGSGQECLTTRLFPIVITVCRT
jgi:arylsulfatase A-like enzyme